MSVGEMTMTSTFSSGNLITTQGFLQPAEMQTGIDDLMLIADTKIHPNPTVGIINCQISSHSIGEVVYRIIDASGKTISQSKQLIEPGYNHHTIDISTTMTGVYYLEIVTSEQTIHKGKAYKIIKI